MGSPARPNLLSQRPRDGEVRGSKGSESEPFEPQTVRVLGRWLLRLASGAGVDDLIRGIAEHQCGRVSRAQLLEVGVSRSAITRRLGNGQLEIVHPGVYGLPHTGELFGAAEAAALLACGSAAVLSHHSAAVLWGLRPGQARPVHVTVPVRHGHKPHSGVKIHRSRTITPRDIRLHQGMPVTSPARTLLDVAATLPDRDVERLLDEALFARRLATRAQIRVLLERVGNHPGGKRLSRVAGLGTRSPATDSPPADALLQLIRSAGLPEPQSEFHVLEYRLDLFWPELNLAVEVDAYGTHGSPARFESDRRRDARLLAEMGILVVRITRMMIEQRPYEALALVARVIGQQAVAVRSLRSRSR